MRSRCGTIERFERALGRKALWARRRPKDRQAPCPINGYVPKLRIYPHALREANAYYDPEKIALLFGYFPATDSSGSVVRGSVIFCVVSHDIVAHETTHALLDGLHPAIRADQSRHGGVPRGFRRHCRAVPALLHARSCSCGRSGEPKARIGRHRRRLGSIGAAVRRGDGHAWTRCANMSGRREPAVPKF